MLAVHYDNVINILLPSRCCWMPLPHGIVCIPCMLHECMCMQEIGYSLVTVHREPMGYKQSLTESVCVTCERQKVTENERAYCTGVHVCVHYSVTSAPLYLYAESFWLRAIQWVVRARLLGFSVPPCPQGIGTGAPPMDKVYNMEAPLLTLYLCTWNHWCNLACQIS